MGKRRIYVAALTLFFLVVVTFYLVVSGPSNLLGWKLISADYTNSGGFGRIVGDVLAMTTSDSCSDPCGGCISPSICMVNCCCLPGQKCVAVGTNDDGSTKYDCQDSCPQGNSACGDSCCEATTEECINNQCLPKCDSDEKRCSTGDCCPMDVDCLPGGGCGISCTGVLCRNENNPEDPMECCDSDKICKSAGGGYYRNCVVDLCANTGSGACCFKYIESGPYLFESYHCQEVGKLECARFPSDCDCVSDRRTECCDIYPDAQGC